MNEMKTILLPAEPDTAERELPRAAMLLFAPLDKRALGVAVGAAGAALVFGITAAHIFLDPEPAIDLNLLSQYFAGYSVSWPGALIGSAWAFGVGFCGGWFTAFTRNLVLALSLFFLRSKAELDESRDFLDHI